MTCSNGFNMGSACRLSCADVPSMFTEFIPTTTHTHTHTHHIQTRPLLSPRARKQLPACPCFPLSVSPGYNITCTNGFNMGSACRLSCADVPSMFGQFICAAVMPGVQPTFAGTMPSCACKAPDLEAQGYSVQECTGMNV